MNASRSLDHAVSLGLAACALLVLASTCATLGCGSSGPSGAAGPAPEGGLVGAGDCKRWDEPLDGKNRSNRQDCIDWEMVGEGLLRLTHASTAFNCCPEFEAGIEVEGGTILVTEHEILGSCHCLCLFDLDYEIRDLAPAVYEVVVSQEHLQPGDEPLEFTMDLVSSPSGSHCVERSHYPWGI